MILVQRECLHVATKVTRPVHIDVVVRIASTMWQGMTFQTQGIVATSGSSDEGELSFHESTVTRQMMVDFPGG